MKGSAIALLNDRVRRMLGFTPNPPGRVVMTRGVASLPADTLAELLQAVRTFDAWTTDNDPYGEHDFGRVDVAGERCFWKIDYYASAEMDAGSEDPADPQQSYRLLTIMLASEY